jgi:hypothetical protein
MDLFHKSPTLEGGQALQRPGLTNQAMIAVHNTEIADRLDELADLLEIENENPFRVRAYRNAARMVRQHPQSFAELVRQVSGAGEGQTAHANRVEHPVENSRPGAEESAGALPGVEYPQHR